MKIVYSDGKENHRKPDFDFFKKFCNYVTYRGIYVNEDVVKMHTNSLELKLNEIRQVFGEYGYIDINPNSPIQVREYFFSNYSEETLKKYFYIYNAKKRDMNYSFGADLIEEFNKFADDPVARGISGYTSCGRRLTLLNKLLEMRDSEECVHPSYDMAVTNRTYSSQPDIESFDISEYVNLFTPDDYGIIELDYRQIEPRLATYMFNIKEFIGFTNDADFYSGVANELLGLNKVTEEQRREIKACWNATTYGASKQKICRMAKHIKGERVYNIFSENKKIQEIWEMLDKNSNVTVSTLFGTPILEENKKNFYSNSRVKVSWMVQGSAADVLVMAVEDMYKKLEENGVEGYCRIKNKDYSFMNPFIVYYTAHDSIKILYAKKYYSDSDIEQIAEDLRSEITYYINEEVLLPVKISHL